MLPFTLQEQRRFYMRANGEVYRVSDAVPKDWKPEKMTKK